MNEYPPTKTPPWQHQKNLWPKIKGKSAFYIAWDMGVGKSKAGIDLCNAIKSKRPLRILITCPAKVVPVWPGQFECHSYADFLIYASQKGSCKQKATEIKNFLTRCEQVDKSAVVVLNYEAVIRPPLAPTYAEKSRRIIDRGLLLSYDWDLLICDEAHRIKAPNGKASWQIARVARKAKRRIFLSGTPMPNSPQDIYAQYRALDPNIFGTSYTRFRARYCVMGGFEARKIIGYQNLEELQQKFYSIADYVEADKVLDLPDKIDRTITCQLGPKARRIYDELESEFVAEVAGGTITVQNALDKLLRLSQIAGGYLVYEENPAENDDAKVNETPTVGPRATATEPSIKRQRIIDNSKIELLVSTLHDLPADEPVVIFCRFHNEMDRLREAIEKEFKGTKENDLKDRRRICEISGRIKTPVDFKNGIWLAQKTNTLIAQIQAASEGIDLTAARYNFYFSMGFSLGQYRQSRRRTRRPGQTRKVFYYHIIAQNTVDRKIMRAIAEKREIVNSVLEQTKHGSFVKNTQQDAIKTALGIFNP